MPVNHGKGEAAIGLNRLQNGDQCVLRDAEDDAET
jgi:hypothetical protein